MVLNSVSFFSDNPLSWKKLNLTVKWKGPLYELVPLSMQDDLILVLIHILKFQGNFSFLRIPMRLLRNGCTK